MTLTQQQLTEAVERALDKMIANNPKSLDAAWLMTHYSEELAAEIFKQLGDV